MTTIGTYQGDPAGPRSPLTPGSYCLARCLCRACPQYAEQHRQTQQLRDGEYARRDRLEGERHARKQWRMVA